MNQLVIEELSQTLADRFMELYVQADILREQRVYMEVRNSAEETSQNAGVFSWESFLSHWATKPEAAVNKLHQLWHRTLIENVIFFYQENRREIGLALVEQLSSNVTGTIKATSTPLALIIQVKK